MTKKKQIPIHDNKYKEELHNCHHTPQTGPDCISDVVWEYMYDAACSVWTCAYGECLQVRGRFFIGQVNQQKIHAKLFWN